MPPPRALVGVLTGLSPAREGGEPAVPAASLLPSRRSQAASGSPRIRKENGAEGL